MSTSDATEHSDDPPPAPTFEEVVHSTEYLCFGGCGAKAMTYIGGWAAVQEWRSQDAHVAWHRDTLKGACGSSSGTIAALAVLVDVPARTLLAKWDALNIDSVAFAQFDLPTLMVSGLDKKFGLDRGDTLRYVIRETLATCGLAADTTFEAFHRLTRKDLRICTTNLSRMRLDVFSHTTTPHATLAQSMYMSMCVPFVFQPEMYHTSDDTDDLFVDGCLMAYVPFQPDWPEDRTLVVYATGKRTGSSPQGGVHEVVDDLQVYAQRVMACCATGLLSRAHALKERRPSHVVHIDVAARAPDADVLFSASATVRKSLFTSGYTLFLMRLRPDLATAASLVLLHGLMIR